MAETVTVTQFDERVRKTVSTDPGLTDIFVVGEISEWKPASSGHVYLTLRDGNATLKCTIWRSSVPLIKFRPATGMKVTAFGSADFYAPYGQFSFIIRNLALYGEGEQKKALEELTARLLNEGLFDPERKRKIPRYPRTIGVVTSETGAVIRDIIRTSRMQFPANILLAPAKVQGEGADLTVIRGIEMLNRMNVDVIIIGRGGGSAEDLSAFNSEALVRAVAASKVPIISAVGHETDRSLTDRAADVYASTPTQAAMLASPPMEEVRGTLSALERRAARGLDSFVNRMRQRFAYPDSRLDANSPGKLIEKTKTQMSGIEYRLDAAMRTSVTGCRSAFDTADAKLRPANALRTLNECGMKMDALSDRADSGIRLLLTSAANRYEGLAARLESDNPHSVLRRGYSYISDEKGNTITSASALSKGTVITVKMRDGRAKAKIEEVEKR